MHVTDLQLLAATGCGDSAHAVGLRLRVSCCASNGFCWCLLLVWHERGLVHCDDVLG